MPKKTCLVIIALGLMMTASGAYGATAKPSATFFSQSWTQASKVSRYSSSCDYTIGGVGTTVAVSDEKTKNVIELTKQAFAKYKKKEVGYLITTDKIVGATLTETNMVDSAISDYINGTTTYYEALAQISQPVTIMVSFIVYPDRIYYTNSTDWKVFADKDLAATLFKASVGSHITDGLTKSGFKFSSWVTNSDKTRSAVYTGPMDAKGTDQLISSILGSNPTKETAKATVKLTINEKTKDWSKYEATLATKTGGLKFTVSESCQAVYGTSVKVTPPVSATIMDPAQGKSELIALLTAIQ